MKCIHCDSDFEGADEAVHVHCHDMEVSAARDNGFDNGKEEGEAERRDAARYEWADSVQRREVRELAIAIRDGDKFTANLMLDRIAESVEGWPDAIATARASIKRSAA